jgi:hypothetical protein
LEYGCLTPTLACILLKKSAMVALSEIFESLGSLEEAVVDKATAARRRQSAAIELGRTLRADFDHAVTALRQFGAPDATRRALVRCFGSLIDGLANAIGAMAESATNTSDRRHPPHDKFAEPTDCILHRINISYRIIGRTFPASPLSNLHGRRWYDLKTCLEIRNRVVHPETPSDLEITDRNIRLLTEVAGDFISDFEALAQWQAERQARRATPNPERRRRRKRNRARRQRTT